MYLFGTIVSRQSAHIRVQNWVHVCSTPILTLARARKHGRVVASLESVSVLSNRSDNGGGGITHFECELRRGSFGIGLTGYDDDRPKVDDLATRLARTSTVAVAHCIGPSRQCVSQSVSQSVGLPRSPLNKDSAHSFPQEAALRTRRLDWQTRVASKTRTIDEH
jgi:hypothetical protein